MLIHAQRQTITDVTHKHKFLDQKDTARTWSAESSWAACFVATIDEDSRYHLLGQSSLPSKEISSSISLSSSQWPISIEVVLETMVVWVLSSIIRRRLFEDVTISSLKDSTAHSWFLLCEDIVAALLSIENSESLLDFQLCWGLFGKQVLWIMTKSA